MQCKLKLRSFVNGNGDGFYVKLVVKITPSGRIRQVSSNDEAISTPKVGYK